MRQGGISHRCNLGLRHEEGITAAGRAATVITCVVARRVVFARLELALRPGPVIPSSWAGSPARP